jgi:hypothetical protein
MDRYGHGAKGACEDTLRTGLMPDLVPVFDWVATPLDSLGQSSETLIFHASGVLFSPIPAILSRCAAEW